VSLQLAVTYHPHMPIGKVSIYRLLFVCLFVCTVTDFSADDKASGVKFCTVVHRRPGHGISHFGELPPPDAQNQTNRPARHCCNVMLLGFCDSHAYQVRAACGRRIGMCGYTAVPDDGRTCLVSNSGVLFRHSAVTVFPNIIFTSQSTDCIHTGSCISCHLEVQSTTTSIEPDLVTVTINQCAKELGRRSFCSEVIVGIQIHRQTHIHTADYLYY